MNDSPSPHFRAGPVCRAIACLALGLLLAPPALAADGGSATDAVKGTVGKVFSVLEDKSLEKKPKARTKRLRSIADDFFDWQSMAQSSLGPTWRELSADQREAFTDVFVDLLAAQYMDDMKKFQGDENYKGETRRGDTTIVKTELVTHSRERIPMDYSLQRTSGGWRIHDLRIEGVSLVNHYRKSFRRFLVNKSFDDLLSKLRQKRG